MKQFSLVLSLPRIVTSVIAVGIIGLIGIHSIGSSSAATTNHLPTGNFGTLSCAWDGTKNDYKYSIPASWSDADKTATSNYYVYLGDKNSVGNYGGYNSLTAGDAIDRTSHTGSSYTWGLYRGVLSDTRWPVKLWVNDIGGTGYVHVASANRPGCPGTGVSLRVNNATSASVTTNANVTLSWSSSNSSGCSAGSSWSGGKSLSGSQVVNVGSPAGTRSYTLTCGNNYASSTTNVTVAVTNPPSSGSGGGTSGSTKSSSGSGGSKNTATASAAAPSSNADSTSTVGTLAAAIKIPAGNASKIHLSYGVTDGPMADTQDISLTGSDATITLTNLQAKTPYSYTIVRTNSAGASATSAATGFTTSGYNVTLSFTDKNKKPVKDLVGNINDTNGTQALSDDNGNMSFTDLDAGTYTVTYTYQGKVHSVDLDTSTATGSADANQPKVVELKDAINVDAIVTTKSGTLTKSKKSSPIGAVLLILFILALLGFGFWYWRRRRQANEIARLYAPAAPLPGVGDVMDQHSMQEFAKNKPAVPGPAPEHMGESLRDMVIKSMQEAERNKQQPPQNPPV